MKNEQPTTEQAADTPVPQDANATPGEPTAKPAKVRKPRAPRKRKPKEAPIPPVADQEVAQPETAAAPPAGTEPDAQDLADAEAERAAMQAEPTAEVAPTAAEGNGQVEELIGAKPRKSGRRAWEINLRGDGQTWERVSTPENEIVFRFKDEPSDVQMDLIERHGFSWDGERKEAYRAEDAEGRAAADKLSWYLKQTERGQGEARAAGM